MESSIKLNDALWQYKGDDGFTFYTKSKSNLLEKAFKNKEAKVKIKINNKEYEIDFATMKQTNISTGYVRDVNRVAIGTKSIEFRKTRWKVKLDNEIKTYEDDINKQIEQVVKEGNNSCSFTTAGKKYMVDIGRMKQINEDTKYERDLIKASYSTGYYALWAYLNDDGQHLIFDDETSGAIEEEHISNTKSFTIDIQKVKHDVDLTLFTLTNQTSKKSRGLKRIPLDALLNAKMWEWEDDEGFRLYRAAEFKAIEDAYNKKQFTVGFSLGRNTYTIDLSNLTQTNENTNKVRKIRRIPSVPPLPASAAAAVKAAANTIGTDTLWECNTDKGYVAYPANICVKLNTAVKEKKKTLTYIHNSTPYLIDLNTMEQINQTTKKARAIRKANSSLSELTKPEKPLQSGCQSIQLKTTNPDYIQVKNFFDNSMNGKYKEIFITLLNNSSAKARYKNFYNTFKLDESVNPQIMLLFHGTSNRDPKLIYEGHYENFDVAHAKSGLWGRGVYFSCDASYSCVDYSYTVSKNVHCILVGEVIIGNFYDYNTNIDTSLLHPPNLPGDPYKRYDSVSGVTSGTRVFVVYNSNQAYAKYMITYTV